LDSITDGTSNTLLAGEKQAPKAFYGQSAKWGDGAIYNGDWPRNFIRIGGPGNGTSTFPLGQGPNDTSGTFHCRFGSDHPGVCQFVCADGHVVVLNNSIDMNTLGLLCTISDGQVAPTP